MAESIQFATEAWVKRFKAEINASESYRQAAKNWEGDFFFIVEADGAGNDPVCMYIDLFHGECREAFITDDLAGLSPEYSISGSLKVWQAIAQKQIDPMKALLTRQLKIKGNMAKIMRNVKAANELVNCTTRFNTEFPAG
jgi:putative sterol carrier protein